MRKVSSERQRATPRAVTGRADVPITLRLDPRAGYESAARAARASNALGKQSEARAALARVGAVSRALTGAEPQKSLGAKLRHLRHALGKLTAPSNAARDAVLESENPHIETITDRRVVGRWTRNLMEQKTPKIGDRNRERWLASARRAQIDAEQSHPPQPQALDPLGRSWMQAARWRWRAQATRWRNARRALMRATDKLSLAPSSEHAREGWSACADDFTRACVTLLRLVDGRAARGRPADHASRVSARYGAKAGIKRADIAAELGKSVDTLAKAIKRDRQRTR